MPRSFRVLQLNSARKYIGEAAHTLNLTEALRQRGHAVWLGLRKGHATFDVAAERKLEPIGFNMPHRWWPPQDAPDLRRIARLVREHKIELIHAHRGKDHWQAVLATRLFHLHVPVIRTRHIVTPLSGNAANRWLARRTAALVAVSRAVAEDVRRTGIYSGERLALIPAGVDLALYRPASAEQKERARTQLLSSLEAPAHGPPLLAACVARFAVVKAHRVLLAAWERVVAELPNARLLLIGDGQLMAESQALVRARGLERSVVFLGRRQDVSELLDAADVGVLSSVGSEGFSRAVLEYMAKGLPTVATRVGAVPDLIEDGVHGAVAPPEDELALAQALRRVLGAEAAQRLEWGRAAREKAERGFGYDTWAAAHEELYANVPGYQHLG
ncbi:MAG: glycosyltransferase family 4 protein [Planctomycetota bacterium]|nr:glycosyltransferase family 4 protein [Planctomycetota bacterium]